MLEYVPKALFAFHGSQPSSVFLVCGLILTSRCWLDENNVLHAAS